MHVTLRAFTHSLRSQYVAGVVLRALHQSRSSCFRVVHYSVQANHLHLLVEAEDKRALSSGMRGLVIRIARRVNQVLFRRGRFWADRWHSSALTSPRQVRNALVYVLKNRHKHAASKPNALDPLSSIQWFDGLAIAVPPSLSQHWSTLRACHHVAIAYRLEAARPDQTQRGSQVEPLISL